MVQRRDRLATPEQQEDMLTAVFGPARPRRVVFSNDNFLCPPQRVVDAGVLYPLATERMPWITALFPDHDTTIAFAMRNPVTMMPALHERLGEATPLGPWMAQLAMESLSWADAVRRIRESVPDTPLLIWCSEDAPLIWPDILAALAGVPEDVTLDGTEDLLARLMTEAGLARMASYLETHPPKSRAHRERITAAFLDKFTRPDAVEVELPEEDWSETRVAAITARYEADIRAIKAMPGVTFLEA